MYNNPDYYPPVINEMRVLDEVGWRVSLIARDYGERWNVQYPGCATIRRVSSPGGSLRQYLHFLATACFRASRGADVFLGHDAHGFLAARILAWRHRRPVVYRCHDFLDRRYPSGMGGRLVQAFESVFARTADLVIVPDRERGQVIESELRLRRPPLVVANAPLRPPHGCGQELRRALAERDKRFSRIVLRQGRIGPGHAIEVTIRSIPMWASRDWGFVLLGFSDFAYVREIEALAASLGVANQLVVLPPVRYDSVALYTAGADIGHALYEPVHVNNEYIATASNKIMEYMAAGLPLLVSDNPGLHSLIQTYGCGMTADETSASDVARAVNRLLSEEADGCAMGAAARRAFDEVFCFGRQYAPALEAIRKLASGVRQ